MGPSSETLYMSARSAPERRSVRCWFTEATLDRTCRNGLDALEAAIRIGRGLDGITLALPGNLLPPVLRDPGDTAADTDRGVGARD
jgi:hypothetical protein